MHNYFVQQDIEFKKPVSQGSLTRISKKKKHWILTVTQIIIELLIEHLRCLRMRYLRSRIFKVSLSRSLPKGVWFNVIGVNVAIAKQTVQHITISYIHSNKPITKSVFNMRLYQIIHRIHDVYRLFLVTLNWIFNINIQWNVEKYKQIYYENFFKI